MMILIEMYVFSLLLLLYYYYILWFFFCYYFLARCTHTRSFEWPAIPSYSICKRDSLCHQATYIDICTTCIYVYLYIYYVYTQIKCCIYVLIYAYVYGIFLSNKYFSQFTYEYKKKIWHIHVRTFIYIYNIMYNITNVNIHRCMYIYCIHIERHLARNVRATVRWRYMFTDTVSHTHTYMHVNAYWPLRRFHIRV